MTESEPGPSGSVTAPPLAEPSSWHDVEMEVNGVRVRGQVESRLLLVDFVRHRVGLTGTHVGCEQGSCGACTVVLDGQAARSCLIFAVQAHGTQVRTVESLAADGVDLNPLQQAFHQEHGLQCGFCTPGFLMSLTALQRSGGNLDEAAIEEQLDGHLCRCTGYLNIKTAACKALLPDPTADSAPTGATEQAR